MNYKTRVLSVIAAICVIIFGGWYILFVSQKHEPTWRGITPGISRESDVLNRLGEPREKSVNPTMFTYIDEPNNDELKWHPHHKIVFKSGKVWLIIEDRVSENKENDLQLDDVISLYGPPDDVLWNTYDAVDRIFLYCSQGIFVKGSDTGILNIFYFSPVSRSDCIQEFKEYIAVDNPFPESNFYMVRDPWGFTLPTDVPNNIAGLWPRPDRELPLNAYKEYIQYRSPEYGVGVLIKLEPLARLGVDKSSYEYVLRKEAKLVIDGQVVDNDKLEILIVEANGHAEIRLSWLPELQVKTYNVKFEFFDAEHQINLSYEWKFSLVK